MTTSHPSPDAEHCSFISWMKCLGILLIVYGHVGSASVAMLTPPVLPKQLGVAFFLFALGFSLAREQRSIGRVLFNRLFEIYLFGLSFAVLVSAVSLAAGGGWQRSNYLPFMLGANLLYDNFPANPTTWYIGTYIHILLFWALVLRNRRLSWWVLLPVAVGEIVVRLILADTAGLYVAYMALSNWATVFLLGICYGQQRHEPEPRTGLTAYLLALVVLIVAWPLIGSLWPRDLETYPFKVYVSETPHAGTALTALAVTLVYLSITWLVFHVTRRLRAPRAVEFCARNTMIVFIAHMPIYWLIADYTCEPLMPAWLGVSIRVAVCLVGLLILSEAIRWLVRPKVLRDRLWLLLTQTLGAKPHPRAESAPDFAPRTPARV
jgi:hypothetical protein